MVAVAAGASILGTVVSMAGANAQAKGQAAAANYNAKIRERNAATADIKADWRTLVNDIETVDFRERFNKLQASTNVAYNKSFVQSDTGTARLVQIENAQEADEEIAVREMQAETEAASFREQGINERLEANLQRIYAKNYRTAGRYKMMSTAISGASRTASLLA